MASRLHRLRQIENLMLNAAPDGLEIAQITTDRNFTPNAALDCRDYDRQKILCRMLPQMASRLHRLRQIENFMPNAALDGLQIT